MVVIETCDLMTEVHLKLALLIHIPSEYLLPFINQHSTCRGRFQETMVATIRLHCLTQIRPLSLE
jgi:hypothetical protein